MEMEEVQCIKKTSLSDIYYLLSITIPCRTVLKFDMCSALNKCICKKNVFGKCAQIYAFSENYGKKIIFTIQHDHAH